MDQDPLKTLKSSSFRLADNWRKRGLLGKDTRWRDIDTTNTVLDFIRNSTKFKFNGKFYKQKFSTPIRSVISPMLAEIVMEDLERSVFERLGFVLPFYFRYVDDTLLCVLLDKLQIVIDTFNDYHPRI